MIAKQISISGATIFWRTGKSNLNTFRAGLAACGVTIVPPDRSPKSILNDALGATYADKQYLIRPLDKRQAFTVVREARGQVRNVYDFVLSASVDDLGTVTIDEYGEAYGRVSEHRRIQDAYAAASGELPGAAVSHTLVKIIESIGGISLRPAGAIYWIPADRLDLWSQVGAVVERCGIEADGNASYMLTNIADAECVRAVRDAVVADTKAAIDRMHEEIRLGKLGERGLDNRLDDAKALSARLGEYEVLLGTTMSDVRAAIEDVSEAIATAALIAAAKAAANKSTQGALL